MSADLAWQTLDSAPLNTAVMTKIDDVRGERNLCALRQGERGIWWFVDGSMYVYYRPTHWRPLTDVERTKEHAKLDAKLEYDRKAVERARRSL